MPAQSSTVLTAWPARLPTRGMSTASRNPPLATATASRAHQMTSERIATTLLRAGGLRDRAEAARQLQPHVRQCLLRVGAADTEQCHTSKTRSSPPPTRGWNSRRHFGHSYA